MKNREIKCRAWNKEKKEMYYYQPLSFLDELDGFQICTTKNKNDLDYVDSHFSKSTTKKMIIMQYTGLKDKNGKEIYEGDIVRYYHKTKNKETGEIKEMDNKEVVSWGEWEDDEYGYKIQTWLSNASYLSEFEKFSNPFWDALEEEFEVIGNIHQNSELLK